mmetsp:Transcript_33441/g.77043  ORF Transcript_33441/g.77043 Transcript_33441/m.77043 type:complete len:251 (-) Transcript_33441:780-1532(-)
MRQSCQTYRTHQKYPHYPTYQTSQSPCCSWHHLSAGSHPPCQLPVDPPDEKNPCRPPWRAAVQSCLSSSGLSEMSQLRWPHQARVGRLLQNRRRRAHPCLRGGAVWRPTRSRAAASRRVRSDSLLASVPGENLGRPLQARTSSCALDLNSQMPPGPLIRRHSLLPSGPCSHFASQDMNLRLRRLRSSNLGDRRSSHLGLRTGHPCPTSCRTQHPPFPRRVLRESCCSDASQHRTTQPSGCGFSSCDFVEV